jgi:hypothetical protein
MLYQVELIVILLNQQEQLQLHLFHHNNAMKRRLLTNDHLIAPENIHFERLIFNHLNIP